MQFEATKFWGCYAALLWQWVTDTPVCGGVVSRGSTWYSVNFSRFHNGSGANTERQCSFPRSKVDENSIPIQPGHLPLDCNSQYSDTWALMGLQDGLPKRLLDRGTGNLEVRVSACRLKTWADGAKRS